MITGVSSAFKHSHKKSPSASLLFCGSSGSKDLSAVKVSFSLHPTVLGPETNQILIKVSVSRLRFEEKSNAHSVGTPIHLDKGFAIFDVLFPERQYFLASIK